MEKEDKYRIVLELSKDERVLLFEMMNHPGWGLLEKVNDQVRENWLNQIVNADYTVDDDAKIIRKLLYRQGLLNGAKRMLSDLDKDKKKFEHQK